MISCLSANPGTLALFDLDNTLLGGDSDYLWGQFLVEEGIVNAIEYEEANRRFYQDYRQGRLDIVAFLQFSLRPLSQHPSIRLKSWRERFIAEKIEPIVLPAARVMVECHRERGDQIAIITATNAFVTEPIAELFGIPHLIATEPEMINGQYSGRFVGHPCFQEGKVIRLGQWMEKFQYDLSHACFYSDSHNDLPLLNRVGNPIAVDPDPKLAQTARRKSWPMLSLRKGSRPVKLS